MGCRRAHICPGPERAAPAWLPPQARGYTATYLMLYLATGEAPEEIRNVFRQRSRWTKGHFQVG
jgi:cellulose synthase/poly-beta-1,6-N-acetylglucosamine synthase-like glycosyltransferase